MIPNHQIQTTPQTSQQSLFLRNLPSKPYCSHDLSYGLRIRTTAHAVNHAYIQANAPVRKLWLMYDIDRPTCPYELTDELLLPAPTLFIQNRENGHAHALYALEVPVHMSEHSSAKAIRFAGAVDVALSQALGADAGYVGLVCKNPLHDRWRTYGIGGQYDLAELAEYVELGEWSDRRKHLPEIGLGRNCTLFDKTRKWAYKAVRDFREAPASVWMDEVLTQALCYNTGFTAPLPVSEVAATAKSIGKYCLKHDKGAETAFRATQAHRGKLGGLASGQARLFASQDKREQALEMHAQGTSKTEIARVLDVHRNTVSNWLK